MLKVAFSTGWYAYTITEIWKIKELFGKMFGMLPKILPDNRILTDRYLTCTWKAFYEVIAAVEHRTVPFGLSTRFASYVEAEEKRLQANLDSIQYNIDGLDALNLVTGPGRIEKVSVNTLSSSTAIDCRPTALLSTCKADARASPKSVPHSKDKTP